MTVRGRKLFFRDSIAATQRSHFGTISDRTTLNFSTGARNINFEGDSPAKKMRRDQSLVK